jgi:hypothetical protein
VVAVVEMPQENTKEIVAKRYDVTVRRRYAGFYKLAVRVARAHGEVRIDSELRPTI